MHLKSIFFSKICFVFNNTLYFAFVMASPSVNLTSTIFNNFATQEGGTEAQTCLIKQQLKKTGLYKRAVKQFVSAIDPTNSGTTSLENFKLALENEKFDLHKRALCDQLIIPDWQSFCNDLVAIFNETKKNEKGANAAYIPQLARVDPEKYGMAVATIDSQIFSFGDCDEVFTIQSCSKPVTYCMAELELGQDKVREHVAHEPSGRKFNHFELNEQDKPHNPMINAGAMMTASLLQANKEPADRFDYAQSIWKKLAGPDNKISFDNATFLSELRHADRNFALAYFMKDAGAFADNVSTAQDLQANLEFYFQLCSILATCTDMALVAATLANSGVNPITKETVFPPQTVRNCLSLMFSCGMYDYSGEFQYSIGLPAKSGVAGCVYVVVPNVMGMAVWSPRLGPEGNSERGVEFFAKLTEKYALHVFDNGQVSKKKNPLQKTPRCKKAHDTAALCYAASEGNLILLRSLESDGADISACDYDGRTPLHLAATEGHLPSVEWLLRHGAQPNPVDRKKNTPLDEAVAHKNPRCADLIVKAGGKKASEL